MAHEYQTDSGKMRVVKGEKPQGLVDMAMKPMFHITSKDLPEVKDWEVGKNYRIEMEVKQKSKSEHDNDHGVMASFTIEKIKAL